MSMHYGEVAGVGKPISRLVLGTVFFGSSDPDTAHGLLDAFRAAGGTAIDTARHYGDAEDVIGTWLARQNREEIVIAGKGAHPHGSPRITREDIAADLTESLRRLGTDYIDIFFLHRDNPEIPIGEIVEWLNEHHAAGRIRAFGGSNWTTERLDAANEYAQAHGLVPFAASSPNLSLAFPQDEIWTGCLSVTPADRAWYQDRQMPLVSWSSQAEGFFTGRYRPDDLSNERAVRLWYSPQNWERYRRATELAQAKGVSANSVALAWVLAQPFPTFAVIGPHTVGELHSSLETLDVSLTPDEVRRLEAG
ncbi:MAG TPA: aldo/keto reductase [Chloroflexota bacterium]|nr:aldo/keto reductase [Chloroflexota bacterium]